MAATLTATITLNTSGEYSSAAAPYYERIANLAKTLTLALTNGTSSNQADLLYEGSGTVDSTGSALDLAGSLTDPLGSTLTFVEVVAILIVNTETATTRNLLIGGAAANAFATPFADSSDKLSLGSGGILLLTSPVDGWAVTAGTGDQLKLAAGGAYTVGYAIVLIGRSA